MIPNPTRPDYYWENQYYLDEEQAERKSMDKAAKVAARNTAIWLSAFFKIAQACFLWSGVLLTAYLILKDTALFISSAVWEKIILLVGVAYLLNCVVFFFKGIMTAQRIANRKVWVLFWLINYCFVCLIPALLVYFFVENLIGPSSTNPDARITGYFYWSIGAGVLSALWIYSKSGLSNNQTIRICNWAYKIGLSTGKRR
ncbi:MAG: hypothetical protein J0I32_23155 [Sphingobacteriales bacterium]|nr:hypothetical protein [Sphingobacteriales bacterium]OJW01942.1 MAG: hypothetical protein BGO52_00200 [Sphingobacteriales bacterium 44-61]